MNTVVAKFGGSSLSNAEQFKKVKAIVQSDKRRRFIVPSAPGKRYKDDKKITDLLYSCHSHIQERQLFDEEFKLIESRYIEIVHRLEINFDIKSILTDIRKRILNGASADYAASRGEYLNGIVLSKYLDMEFLDAAEVIFFDSSGAFDPEKTQSIISDRLSKLGQAVIPGFYGSLPDGSVKTFSRGGSDITGAIVARGANAEIYENWTDVSGFLMADPKIVENPKVMEKITYRELRELSYMGATVLHDEAIFPVRQAGIPINIKNTNSPDDPGTLIVKDDNSKGHGGTITGIAGSRGFTIIVIEKAMMNSEIGFGRKLLSILEQYKVSFEHMPTGIDSISLVIETAQLDGNIDNIIKDIENHCKPDYIQVIPDIALIATVGRGMAYTKGTSAKIFTALSNAEVNIRMIDQGSSEINIIIGVENHDFEKAVRRIYNAFK